MMLNRHPGIMERRHSCSAFRTSSIDDPAHRTGAIDDEDHFASALDRLPSVGVNATAMACEPVVSVAFDPRLGRIQADRLDG